jgi:serine/threonine protein kinase/tetratricopeptide (TPR) repeat protein
MAVQSNQAKSIFLTAIDEHAPERWPAFLDQACAGDTLLRAEVERLLDAHAALGSFHEAPQSNLSATVDQSIRERPGTAVGPYKLLEQIGEGGFGVVFLAEQQGPIRRRVALKIIKPGMDTRQVIARFEVERQALALMDHPNIARVLDAGATESGRPYFVMELVKGVSITEFCDRDRLAPEARLKLFLDVCHAIQHAHHKGVIHRDIKPSNVLVTLQDGAPVVKVIDFGVAKATGQNLTERTLFTGHGQMIGTPAYMSPEQAQMSGLDIDTRTDVYALGVLLYELLTGTTPLEDRRLQQVGYAEMQRLIREEEAPRPSTRLSSLGDTAAALAGNRGLDAKRLQQILSGDLDWAVMKSLEKDRNRRYETPASFAEDIARYLRSEALLARPPSTAYQVKKFIQRNRAAVLTGTAVAAALTAGAVIATWQAVVATRAKEVALAREAELQAVLQFVEDRVFAAARPKGQPGGLGHKVTLRRAVEAALPYVESGFADQPLIEARLRLTLGLSFSYLGDAKSSAEQCRRARTLYTEHLGPDHPDTLRSMHGLARSYHDLGRYADALRLNEETLALRRARLGPYQPDTLQSMNNLAVNLDALGRHAEALRVREETLNQCKAWLGPDHPTTLMSMHNLAITYQALGRIADALKLREETLASRQARLGPDHLDTLTTQEDLACSYHDVGRHAEAVRLKEETLALRRARLGPDHPDTLRSMGNLANSYHAIGRVSDAVRLHEETLALRRSRLGPDHPATLMSMSNLAAAYVALGRYDDALKLSEEALARRTARLGPDHPYTLRSMWLIAECLVKLERGAEAVPVIDECVRRSAGKAVRADLLPSVMVLRLRHFEKAGDAAGCRQTAEMWEGLKRTDAVSLYNAACLRAVTAAVFRAADDCPAGVAEADAEADRAMAWLKQAVAAGYKDAEHMRKDTDLDALRGRADFMELVAVLEGARDPLRIREGGPSDGSKCAPRSSEGN